MNDGKSCFNCKNYGGHRVCNFYGLTVHIAPDAGCSAFEKKDKPHICNVLGVDVGERFTFPYPQRSYDWCAVHDDGVVWAHNDKTGDDNKIGPTALCWLINHIDTIQRLPAHSTNNNAICKALGIKWISKNNNCSNFVDLWSERPTFEDGVYISLHAGTHVATISGELFPSVKPGTLIKIG